MLLLIDLLKIIIFFIALTTIIYNAIQIYKEYQQKKEENEKRISKIEKEIKEIKEKIERGN